ncbi:hypothetical protein FKB34_11700 [Glycocaulis profundi]|nr:hypothetical protein FKB34_11700 [Glycocaulis profundi]
MTKAEEIFKRVSCGFKKAHELTELMLGMDESFTRFPDLRIEYIITTKVLESLISADRLVLNEVRFRNLREYVLKYKLKYLFRQRSSREKNLIINDKSKSRIDIVTICQNTVNIEMICEIKQSMKIEKIKKDTDRMMKIYDECLNISPPSMEKTLFVQGFFIFEKKLSISQSLAKNKSNIKKLIDIIREKAISRNMKYKIGYLKCCAVEKDPETHANLDCPEDHYE